MTEQDPKVMNIPSNELDRPQSMGLECTTFKRFLPYKTVWVSKRSFQYSSSTRERAISHCSPTLGSLYTIWMLFRVARKETGKGLNGLSEECQQYSNPLDRLFLWSTSTETSKRRIWPQLGYFAFNAYEPHFRGTPGIEHLFFRHTC